MSTTLWDTTGGDVVKALVAERRAAGAMASGLAVTLVVVVDQPNLVKAEQAAMVASQQHPCRLIIVIRQQVTSPDRLDAEVQVSGRLGPIEAVVMRMAGRLSLHAESVVLPLLAPDAPVVTWWHGPPPDELAADPLAVLADRRVTDSSLAPDPVAALRQRVADFAPGDTDLAWTRVTPWRSLLASAFDGLTATATGARVEAEAGNPSATLLSAWLAGRLGVQSEVVESHGPGVTEVKVSLREYDPPPNAGANGDHAGELRISRPDGRLATLSRTGQPERQLPLLRRALGDLLAEEVRRLDVDEVYGETLATATGVTGLAERSPKRTLVWRDPATSSAG